MNSESVDSNDLGTPDYNGSKGINYDKGPLDMADQTKKPVEYVSTGGPKDTGAKQISSDVPMPDKTSMHSAMLRRLTQFFTR